MSIVKGKHVRIGKNTQLNNVIIKDNVSIGANCIIFGSSKRKVIIGENSYISPNCYMNGYFGLKIGKDVTISERVSIFSDSGPNKGLLQKVFKIVKKKIIINDGCWIGAHCILLPGSEMEKNSVLATNSVLKTKVAELELYAGSPAKFKYKINV